MTAAPLLLAIALFALYIFRSVRTFYSLKQFPGHWSAGWSRIWLLRTQGSGQMNRIFTAVNDQYGEENPSSTITPLPTWHSIRRFAGPGCTLRWLRATVHVAGEDT